MGQDLTQAGQRLLLRCRLEHVVPAPPQQRLMDPLGAVDETVAEPAAIAKEVAVDLTVVAVEDSPHLAEALVGRRVAAETAMGSDRRRFPQIPFAVVEFRKRLVVKHTGRADLGQITAELVFEDAVFMAAEINVTVYGKDIEVAPASIVAVESNAAVTGNAPIHLVCEK